MVPFAIFDYLSGRDAREKEVRRGEMSEREAEERESGVVGLINGIEHTRSFWC